MRVHVVKVLAALCVFSGVVAAAQPLEASPEAIQELLQSYVGPTALEPPMLVHTDEGFLRFAGAPPEGQFVVEGAQKAAGPEAAAQQFMQQHREAFGMTSTQVQLELKGSTARPSGHYVRLQQAYGGIEVFGAQVMVRTDGDTAVLTVLSDILRDTRSLDLGQVPLQPAVSEQQAVQAAKREIAGLYSEVTAGDLQVYQAPNLVLFRPDVVGLEGPTRLVYHLSVGTAARDVLQVVMVDTQSGAVVFRYSLVHEALDRSIYDADFAFNFPDEPARSEGDGPTGITDVDNAYDFIGDTYNFFLEQHGRDGLDDAGIPLEVLVNLPFENAFYLAPDFLGFGYGYAADDVVAHEYTHGVTEFTSQLIYFGFSGAINESFSDIWGEFVDLTNGRGDDRPEMRWFMGEDIYAELFGKSRPKSNPLQVTPKQLDQEIPPFAIRYMKDPTVFGDPDRLGSPLLINPNSFFDNGGVHINSGIGNKLCYLLTDGDSFNGQTVTGMGIEQVAELFYETQFILTPASDYYDLYLALSTASAGLGYSFEERLNIAAACRAVEIVPPQLLTESLRHLRATPTRTTGGSPVIALNWTPPPATQYRDILVLRSVRGFVNAPGEGLTLFQGRGDRFLDREVQEGVEYFYTVIADRLDAFPEVAFARATAGATAGNYLSEAFRSTGQQPAFDLSFSQLLFSPVGAPAAELGASGAVGIYADYTASLRRGVTQLPVPRQDERGGAFLLHMTADGGINYFLGDQVFPYFGQLYSRLYVASNGYISFFPVPDSSPLNFPSLGAHFAVPRISYLFSDLEPSIGGEVWARSLEDRLVLTLVNVPEYDIVEFGGLGLNTVQVELFFSGHIRITYQQVSARNAVVGLSDGNGVPIDPTDLFPGVRPVVTGTDFSTQPGQPPVLTFAPTYPPRVDAGGLAEFSVSTTTPAGTVGVPLLTAVWNRPGLPPFVDHGNGTGRFSWQTELRDQGLYTVRVHAHLNGAEAYQDVRVAVGRVFPAPQAHNLRLGTDAPGEDPTRDRVVPGETALYASYDYFHPLEADAPFLFAEGPSLLYWMRNGMSVQSMFNQPSVPANLTRGGETWQFRLLPLTTTYLAGDEAVSPTVTIYGVPEIVSVTPGFSPTSGGRQVTILGSRLSSALSVKFGGVEVSSIQAVSDGEVRVIAPVRNAGTVSVSVTTPYGTGTLRNGFIYTGNVANLLKADVNGDGRVDAVDIQLVVNALLEGSGSKSALDADVNLDGAVNSLDIQMVVNLALRR